MKELPRDPFALQARMVSNLCDDIMDPQARKDGTFPRMAAMRATLQAEEAKTRFHELGDEG